jgi:hypothetical protein
MSKRARYTLSRRAALTGVAITAAYGSAVAEQGSDSMSGENGAGPAAQTPSFMAPRRDFRLPIARLLINPVSPMK